MITEAARTRQFILAYRTIRPAAVVLKHNERITAGVPDLSITDAGQTWWVECKRTDGALTGLQLRMLANLRRASRHKVAIVWFDPDGVRVVWDGPTGAVVEGAATVRDAAACLARRIEAAA